jgi:hypothetical protein
MYFWNTNKLIDDLKNERLATSDYKNYYLAGGVGALLMVFCMRFSPVTNMILSTIDIVLSIIMLIIGINLCFRVNGGNQGRQFLNRLICIVLPISIRILLVYFLFFIFMIIILVFSTRFIDISQTKKIFDPYQGWITLATSMLIQTIMYWRFYVALKKIND